ncbi:MAG: DUF4331 family protein [Solirubrobacterales bacterium]|nr:DUF4331 family protein [Solirubrobacterales bacterium]
MSDHFSGPRALAGPAGDISDVYAFPSPERPGHLCLSLGVEPLASADKYFSPDILCRFRLRPVTIAGTGADTAFPYAGEEEEISVTLSFDAPRASGANGGPVQQGTCTTSDGQSARFVVGDEAGGRGDGLRVYAGRRSDPFFLDLVKVQESVDTGRVAFTQPGTNNAHGFNLLCIVVELDCRQWTKQGRGPLFAVVGETVVAGGLPIRLERMGRPEIKNMLLGDKRFDAVNRNLEVRDLYNLEDPFHMSRDYRDVYRARLDANLHVFDRLDGVVDWPLGPNGEHPLTSLLLADYLIVDISKPYATDTFFEIELAALEGREHQTCGGRSFNVDAMDPLFTLYICGLSGRQVSQGVPQATVPASDVFPFLAPPNVPGVGIEDVIALVAPK